MDLEDEATNSAARNELETTIQRPHGSRSGRKRKNNNSDGTTSASGSINDDDNYGDGNNLYENDTPSSRINIEYISQRYNQLEKIEKILLGEYEKLRKEEQCLRTALQQSKESGRERLAREKREKEESALSRLEEALMIDDSSTSDGDSDSSSSLCKGEGSGEDEGGAEGTKKFANSGNNDLSIDSVSSSSSSDEDIDEETFLQML